MTLAEVPMSTSVVRRPESEWALLVAEWRASGKARTTFAAERRVNASTLAWWTTELARRERERATRFVEVVVAEERVAPDLVVEVVGRGVNVHVPAGFDANELRRLVGALC
jgi:hypothetical protein